MSKEVYSYQIAQAHRQNRKRGQDIGREKAKGELSHFRSLRCCCLILLTYSVPIGMIPTKIFKSLSVLGALEKGNRMLQFQTKS